MYMKYFTVVYGEKFVPLCIVCLPRNFEKQACASFLQWFSRMEAFSTVGSASFSFTNTSLWALSMDRLHSL